MSGIDNVALARSEIVTRSLRAARYFEMVATLAEMGDDRMAKLMEDAASREWVQVASAFGDLHLFKMASDLDPDRKREEAA